MRKKEESKEKKDILVSFFNELHKVEDNDRSLVVVSHGFIELLINTIIDAQLKHGKRKITNNNRDYPHSVKLVILNELNIIDNKLY